MSVGILKNSASQNLVASSGDVMHAVTSWRISNLSPWPSSCPIESMELDSEVF